MSYETPQLVISSSPFVKRAVDTPRIMRHVIYALLPAMLAAVYLFGLSAILLLVACTAGAVLSEWAFGGRGPLRDSPIADGSAVVTGMLLAMTLPPGLPLWMAFLGGAVAIILGKLLFGGLGMNVFNPSLTGRAFLQASFPVAITTWSGHSDWGGFLQLRGDNLALPFVTPSVDAVSSATPLAAMKFESEATAIADMLVGTISGSMGETSALLLLLGGAYLAYRKFLNWRIPVGIFATVFILASVLNLIDADKYPSGLHHLFGGGLVLGAVFMATDPVSSPVTPRGSWVFAFGIGFLVVLIRQFGGLPEGVMYSILLMNAATPLIDRVTQPRIYGAAPRSKKAEKKE